MKLLGLIVIGIVLVWGSFGVNPAYAAEQYPAKPINFIVPNEAGADADVLARPICQGASAILGKPLVIVNKPGGGSSIGMREVHDAKPDGYTIGMSHATILINKLMGSLPYDHAGFTVLGTYATFIPIIVSSAKTQRPFKTMGEVIAFAKANPGEVSIATSGVGQSWWVAAMSFLGGTGLNINTIPQAGTGAITTAQVAGGHAELGVVALGSGKSMIEGGQVKFLATLGEARAPAPYDKVPTVKELGYDVSWESTNFLMGPPKMPKEIVTLLVNTFEKVVKEPEFVKHANGLNARWEWIPPDKMVPAFDKRRDTVREIMRKAGILKEIK